MPARRSLVGLLVVLAACGGPTGDAADAGVAADAAPGADGGDGGGEELADLEIGSADLDGSGFVELDGEVDVALVPGSQGGFHIWTSMRVRGASGSLVVVRTARRVRDGALILNESPYGLEVPPAGELDWWQPDFAAPSFMCPSPLGVELRDETIDLVAELRDEDDRVLATDAVRVTPRCPADDDFCLEICSG